MNKAENIAEIYKHDELVAFDMIEAEAVDYSKNDNDTIKAYFDDGSDLVFTQLTSTHQSSKIIKVN